MLAVIVLVFTIVQVMLDPKQPDVTHGAAKTGLFVNDDSTDLRAHGQS